MLFHLHLYQMNTVSFMYQFGKVRGFEQKLISLQNCLLCAVTPQILSANMLWSIYILNFHFWSLLLADSQLISETCRCLKLFADVLKPADSAI